MSTAYYDANAQAYFDSTVTVDVSAIRDRFLAYLPPGGAILDAGCGSGRDAKGFSEAGYEVTAFDASAEMVKLACAYAGLEVLWMTFDEVDWVDRFDGIWACASLLHVPRDRLPVVFKRLARALRPGGAWYFSMKLGITTREQGERYFTDIQPDEAEALVSATGLVVAALWQSDGVQLGSTDRWVNAIASKRSNA